MKTVFQRALSLVMCLVLICSTVSVMAFGASEEEAYDYKTYFQHATKENVHYLFDAVDETLKKENIKEEIDLGLTSMVVDLTSVDAVCATIDRFRTVINVVKVGLGDLKKLKLGTFDKKMSRSKSGDVKILSEFIDLLAANTYIIEELLSGDLDLGLFGKLAKVDFSEFKVGEAVRTGVVDALFEKDPNYETIKARALKDFDEFVYTDIVGLVSKEGGILEGVSLKESTTVNDLIIQVYNIIIEKYIIGFIKEQNFTFEGSLGADYKKLDEIINMGGEYNFDDFKLEEGKSVLEQVNNILGEIVKQAFPKYEDNNDWTSGDYTNIGNNMRALVKYIAKESGLIKEDVDTKSDEVLMLEIIKIIAKAADTDGEKEVYNAIEKTTTLTEMVNALFRYLGRDIATYTGKHTYEHVVGDWLITQIEKYIPLYDENGKTIAVGSGKTVWDVVNSVLNFLFVDKNFNAFFGTNITKSQSFFEKLDILIDETADDGTADFNSEKYIKGLIDCLFRIDLQGFVNETAVRALNFAGDISVVKFLYNTAYNLLNNWSDSSTTLEKYTTAPFNSAISDDGIANIIKVLIETLGERTEGTAWVIGVFYCMAEKIVENISEKAPTCTTAGYKLTRSCPKCDVKLLQGAAIPATGHNEKSEVVKTATCTVAGETKYYCTTCGVTTRTTPIPATGHNEKSKVAKTATCTAAGETKYYCTTCGVTTRTTPISATGHKEKSKVEKAATCTTDGKMKYYCATCGVTTRTTTIKKTGHNYSTSKVTKKATCSATGVKTYYCSKCSATKTETIAKTKHKEAGYIVTKKATYKAKGTKVNKCSVCSAVIDTKSISMLTLSKPTSLKATAVSTTSIKYSWKAVKGAEEYILYYKTGSGKWKKVTVKNAKTSYTVTKLKAGTTYKFKVVAVAGSNKSKSSSEVSSSTKPSSVTLKDLRSKRKKEIVVEWKKLSGVTGYEIQYSTSKKFTSKTTKTVTVKSQKTYKTIIKKLKSGKKYYVKVRAYKTINKKPVYGAFSKVKSIKCK